MQYEDRLVAFLDVLGFQELINETVNADGAAQSKNIRAISEAYDVIDANWASDRDDPRSRSKQVTIFSDSIVVSVRATEKSQIFRTLLEVKHLIMSLLERSILVRGAIVRGGLIHDGVKVFGPALIEAYNLESRAALYPRVILDRDLVDLAADYRSSHHSSDDEVGYVTSLLEQDSDGMYYIDYFYRALDELDDPVFYPAYITNLGEIIRKGLRSFTKPTNSHVRNKYTWMRERYNKMVDTAQAGLKNRDWANDDPADDLELFYSQLKKISGRRR